MIPNRMIWPCLPLAKFCDIKIGRTPERANAQYWGPGYPWLSIADMQQGKNLVVTKETITQKAVDECHCYQVQPGTLLISFKLSIGKLGFARVPLYTNEAIAALIIRGQKQIVSDYLYYALQVIDLVGNTDRAVKGKTLDTEKLSLLPIPLPPLPEQHRIASILSKAEHLRRLRRYALELSGMYLQTVFLEMFGDPVANPKGWAIERLGERISFITSGSRGWARYYSNKGAIFLRIQNVGRNQLLLDDLAYVQVPDRAEGQRTRVRNGDLLLSITADLGRTAVIPENFPEAYINQHLALLRLEKLNPVFVAGFISTPGGKAQITQLDREGVKSGLNFDDIRGYQIFVPPLSLQDKYAQIVQKYERFRAQQREAIRQADHLFHTLLHQAFQGELEPEPLPSKAELENAVNTSIIPNIPDIIEGEIHQLYLPVE